jgi:hypothetical protein
LSLTGRDYTLWWCIKMWMLQAATKDLTSWQDPDWNYWVVDPNNGYIWDWKEL